MLLDECRGEVDKAMDFKTCIYIDIDEERYDLSTQLLMLRCPSPSERAARGQQLSELFPKAATGG